MSEEMEVDTNSQSDILPAPINRQPPNISEGGQRLSPDRFGLHVPNFSSLNINFTSSSPEPETSNMGFAQSIAESVSHTLKDDNLRDSLNQIAFEMDEIVDLPIRQRDLLTRNTNSLTGHFMLQNPTLESNLGSVNVSGILDLYLGQSNEIVLDNTATIAEPTPIYPPDSGTTSVVTQLGSGRGFSTGERNLRPINQGPIVSHAVSHRVFESQFLPEASGTAFQDSYETTQELLSLSSSQPSEGATAHNPLHSLNAPSFQRQSRSKISLKGHAKSGNFEVGIQESSNREHDVSVETIQLQHRPVTALSKKGKGVEQKNTSEDPSQISQQINISNRQSQDELDRQGQQHASSTQRWTLCSATPTPENHNSPVDLKQPVTDLDFSLSSNSGQLMAIYRRRRVNSDIPHTFIVEDEHIHQLRSGTNFNPYRSSSIRRTVSDSIYQENRAVRSLRNPLASSEEYLTSSSSDDYSLISSPPVLSESSGTESRRDLQKIKVLLLSSTTRSHQPMAIQPQGIDLEEHNVKSQRRQGRVFQDEIINFSAISNTQLEVPEIMPLISAISGLPISLEPAPGGRHRERINTPVSHSSMIDGIISENQLAPVDAVTELQSDEAGPSSQRMAMQVGNKHSPVNCSGPKPQSTQTSVHSIHNRSSESYGLFVSSQEPIESLSEQDVQTGFNTHKPLLTLHSDRSQKGKIPITPFQNVTTRGKRIRPPIFVCDPDNPAFEGKSRSEAEVKVTEQQDTINENRGHQQNQCSIVKTMGQTDHSQELKNKLLRFIPIERNSGLFDEANQHKGLERRDATNPVTVTFSSQPQRFGTSMVRRRSSTGSLDIYKTSISQSPTSGLIRYSYRGTDYISLPSGPNTNRASSAGESKIKRVFSLANKGKGLKSKLSSIFNFGFHKSESKKKDELVPINMTSEQGLAKLEEELAKRGLRINERSEMYSASIPQHLTIGTSTVTTTRGSRPFSAAAAPSASPDGGNLGNLESQRVTPFSTPVQQGAHRQPINAWNVNDDDPLSKFTAFSRHALLQEVSNLKMGLARNRRRSVSDSISIVSNSHDSESLRFNSREAAIRSFRDALLTSSSPGTWNRINVSLNSQWLPNNRNNAPEAHQKPVPNHSVSSQNFNRNTVNDGRSIQYISEATTGVQIGSTENQESKEYNFENTEEETNLNNDRPAMDPRDNEDCGTNMAQVTNQHSHDLGMQNLCRSTIRAESSSAAVSTSPTPRRIIQSASHINYFNQAADSSRLAQEKTENQRYSQHNYSFKLQEHFQVNPSTDGPVNSDFGINISRTLKHPGLISNFGLLIEDSENGTCSISDVSSNHSIQVGYIPRSSLISNLRPLHVSSTNEEIFSPNLCNLHTQPNISRQPVFDNFNSIANINDITSNINNFDMEGSNITTGPKKFSVIKSEHKNHAKGMAENTTNTYHGTLSNTSFLLSSSTSHIPTFQKVSSSFHLRPIDTAQHTSHTLPTLPTLLQETQSPNYNRYLLPELVENLTRQTSTTLHTSLVPVVFDQFLSGMQSGHSIDILVSEHHSHGPRDTVGQSIDSDAFNKYNVPRELTLDKVIESAETRSKSVESVVRLLMEYESLLKPEQLSNIPEEDLNNDRLQYITSAIEPHNMSNNAAVGVHYHPERIENIQSISTVSNISSIDDDEVRNQIKSIQEGLPNTDCDYGDQDENDDDDNSATPRALSPATISQNLEDPPSILGEFSFGNSLRESLNQSIGGSLRPSLVDVMQDALNDVDQEPVSSFDPRNSQRLNNPQTFESLSRVRFPYRNLPGTQDALTVQTAQSSQSSQRHMAISNANSERLTSRAIETDSHASPSYSTVTPHTSVGVAELVSLQVSYPNNIALPTNTATHATSLFQNTFVDSETGMERHDPLSYQSGFQVPDCSSSVSITNDQKNPNDSGAVRLTPSPYSTMKTTSYDFSALETPQDSSDAGSDILSQLATHSQLSNSPSHTLHASMSNNSSDITIEKRFSYLATSHNTLQQSQNLIESQVGLLEEFMNVRQKTISLGFSPLSTASLIPLLAPGNIVFQLDSDEVGNLNESKNVEQVENSEQHFSEGSQNTKSSILPISQGLNGDDSPPHNSPLQYGITSSNATCSNTVGIGKGMNFSSDKS